MKKTVNRKSLIMYMAALFSAAVFIIVISYLYNMRAELEKELATVRAELDDVNKKYNDLLITMEEQ